MKKLLRWLFKPLRQVVFFVRRAQYNLGFRDSKLVYSKQFPDAPYRAVVFGLEEDMWEYFDSAYPEYEKIFAPLNTHIVELRAVLARKKIMLLVFDKAPRRSINYNNCRTNSNYLFWILCPITNFAEIRQLCDRISY